LGLLTVILLLSPGLTGCGGRDDDGIVAAEEALTVRVEGTILEVARGASALVIQADDDRMWSVPLAPAPVVVVDRPTPGSLIDLLPGFAVAVQGRQRGIDTVVPDTIRVLETPPLVLVRPRPGVALTRPVIPIAGHAVRGRNPTYRLLHGSDVIAEGSLRNEAVGARHYGSFRHELPLPRYGLDGSLVLEVALDRDAEPVRREIRFAPERTLNLYYPSREADPQRLRCDAVYPYAHRAPVLLSPADVVALLMHPPEAEQRRRGLFSELAHFDGLGSIRLEGQAAAVDLRLAQGRALPDECARQTARAQLERTIEEAFGVESVRVTVNGRAL
jgi:hypothetical protein